MIKIENIDIYGWEAAIRGMRNPINSWEKSDSDYGCKWADDSTKLCRYCDKMYKSDCNIELDRTYIIGPNDLDLMTRLAKAGSVHAKFRRMINVTMDITAPLYWWKEFDTYKVGTVANSCSTMHKIQAKEFTLEDFSCEHLYSGQVDETRTFSLEKGIIEGWSNQAFYNPLDILKATIEILNAYRTNYLDSHEKEDWWQMIQLLPSSYNQRRTVQLNYEVLAHMYHDRKDHKLDEWCEFCIKMHDLPYAAELIVGLPEMED